MELLTVGILLVDLFCSLIHRKLTFNSMRMRQQQKIGFGNTEEQIVELACEKFERLIVGHPVRYLLGIPSSVLTLYTIRTTSEGSKYQLDGLFSL